MTILLISYIINLLQKKGIIKLKKVDHSLETAEVGFSKAA